MTNRFIAALGPFAVLFGLLGFGPAGQAQLLPSGDAAAACRAAIAMAERERAMPAGLLQAIGRVESGRRGPATGQFAPWPWTINAEGRGMFFPTREAAIAEVRQLQSRGVRIIDIGCMQVNLHHHPRAFASLEEAFDPVSNARYAAQFLTQLQAARGDWMVAAGHSSPRLARARWALSAVRSGSALGGGVVSGGWSRRFRRRAWSTISSWSSTAAGKSSAM